MTDINDFWRQHPSGNFRARPVFDGTQSIPVTVELTDDNKPLVLTAEDGSTILIAEQTSQVIGVLYRFD